MHQETASSRLARLEANLSKAATLREGRIEQVKTVAAQSAVPRGASANAAGGPDAAAESQ